MSQSWTKHEYAVMPLFQIIFIFPIIFIFRLWKTRKVKAELGICNHRASDQYFAFDLKVALHESQIPLHSKTQRHSHFLIVEISEYILFGLSVRMHIYVNTLSNLC